MRDGLEFEKLFMSEVEMFAEAALGVSADAVMAALVAQREGREELRELIHSRKLQPVFEILDDDDFTYDPEDGREVIELRAADSLSALK